MRRVDYALKEDAAVSIMMWKSIFILIIAITFIRAENFNINDRFPHKFQYPAPGGFSIPQLRAAHEKSYLDLLFSNSSEADFPGNPHLKLIRERLIQNKDAILSASDGQCLLDSLKFFLDLNNMQFYTLLALDTYGKIPAGRFSGNTVFLGEYDQCVWMDIPTSETTHFKGKHCMVLFVYPLGGESIHQEGICIPKSCGPSVGALYAVAFLPGLGIPDPLPIDVACYEDREFSGGDIAALVILSVFGLLCLTGTALDLLVSQENGQQMSLMFRFFTSFSWLTNGKKLLSAKVSAGQLTCLNGLRTLSMFWVILGHSALFPLGYTENIVNVFLTTFPTFAFQGILNADFCVDTFFFLSGLLVGYLTLKALQKMPTSRVKFWGLFYFHRIWRLTPVYMLCLMFWTTLFLHIPEGPFARYFESVTDPCKYWWTNLLYFNNFYPFRGDNGLTCMGWTWYLANDLQFFIFSPIILLLFYHLWIVGLVVCFVLVAGCVIATGVVANEYQIYPDYNNTAVEGALEMESQMYVRPYFRLVPYVIGLVIGWMLIKYRSGVKMPWIVALIGWVFAGGSCMALIYGWLPYRDGSATINVDVGIAYFALKRLTWSVGVAWVAFACLNGYGGPINWFLSWKIWIPLGRLTYCAYLIHPILMYAHLINGKRNFYMDGENIAEFFVVSLVTTYACAVVVSLTLESPFMALEKLFLGGRSSGVDRSKSQEHARNIEETTPESKPTHINGGPVVFVGNGTGNSHEVDTTNGEKGQPLPNGNHVAYINQGYTEPIGDAMEFNDSPVDSEVNANNVLSTNPEISDVSQMQF